MNGLGWVGVNDKLREEQRREDIIIGVYGRGSLS